MSTKAQLKPQRFMALLAALVVGIALVVAGPPTTPAFAEPSESVQIGMPFAGTWAYNVATTLPCGNDPEVSSTAHPSCHHTPGNGNWGTDVYTGAGTAFKLRLSNATGTVTASWESSSTSCGSSIRLLLKVDGVDVARIYVAHIDNPPNAAQVTAASNAGTLDGFTLGTVHSLCYGVNHAHYEVGNASGYSCYFNKSTATHTAGIDLAEGVALGKLGATGATDNRQVCGTSTPPPPAGNGTDTFGTYNTNTATFYISNALAPSVAEAVFPYGNAGWVPLTGDWNGDGIDTFGSYNPATATFYISNSMSPSVAEATFTYGNAGWIPLVGDWDGNGTDTFGTYNPATATFYISNAMMPSAAEAVFAYGNVGWTPLIGDWDGNRTDTFGSYNPATATFYITNAMSPGGAEAVFAYGNTGWIPLIGDWNGDRIDTFGSYNPNTATFYISNAMSPSVAEATFMYGNVGWIPLIGDWNGQ